jgi:hypothetical protein
MRDRFRVVPIALFVCLLGGVSHAAAAPIQFDFSGTVSYIGGSGTAASLQLGDAFTGTLVYDYEASAATGTSSGQWIPVASLAVDFGLGRTLASAHAPAPASALSSRFYFGVPTAGAVAGWGGFEDFMLYYTGTPDSQTGLPSPDTLVPTSIYFTTPWGVRGEVTDYARVPEPTPALLLAAALFTGTVLTRRWARRPR